MLITILSVSDKKGNELPSALVGETGYILLGKWGDAKFEQEGRTVQLPFVLKVEEYSITTENGVYIFKKVKK